MNEVIGIWRIIWLEMKQSFVIFWSILIGTTLLGLLGTVIFQLEEIIFVTNVPLYIYFTIIGAQLFRLALTYGTSFGSTRTQFYIGAITGGAFLVLLGSAIHALVYLGLNTLAFTFVPAFEIKHFFPFLLTMGDGVFPNFLVDSLFSLMVLSIGCFFSTLYYRYGSLPLYLSGAFLVLTGVFPVTHQYWQNFFRFLYTSSLFEVLSAFFIIALVAFLIPLMFIRKFNIYRKGNAS
ncbi:hypothetical protein [Alteribacter populi]|uniref:hypothetical protein n=1 Tax=Alteribacter populi TaxID=2011011 RepID=UPI000BBB6686|nr:hypothetical protein [Alteribacter populi]